MTGEEAYNRDFLYVLNKIQKQLLLFNASKAKDKFQLTSYRIEIPKFIDDYSPIEYKTINQKIIDGEVPSPETEERILKNLDKSGELKIFSEPEDLPNFEHYGYPGNSYIIYKDYGLAVDKKAFKMIFEKYTDKSKHKNIEPLEIPLGTRWSEIEIKFKNIFDVEIYINGTLFRKTNNVELGFFNSNSKDNNANVSWELLRCLAGIYASAKTQKIEVPYATIEELTSAIKVGERNTIETRKRNLSKQLKMVFGIAEDPFDDYGHWGYYKTRFTLTAEPELRAKDIYRTGKRFSDDKFSKDDNNTNSKYDDEEESFEDTRDDEVDSGNEDSEDVM